MTSITTLLLMIIGGVAGWYATSRSFIYTDLSDKIIDNMPRWYPEDFNLTANSAVNVWLVILAGVVLGAFVGWIIGKFLDTKL